MTTAVRSIAAFVACQHMLVSSALAWPAVTTANVNLRSGPGTDFSIARTIGEGTDIEVSQCDPSGSWCAVTANGRAGFMSGDYLKATDLPDQWPRKYLTGAGADIVLHQPQISEWNDFESVTALVAAEYRKSGAAAPEFGVIEFTAETHVDHDSGDVLVSDIRAVDLNFSTLDRNALADVALKIGEIIPVEPLTMPLERITASLESYQQLTDVLDLKSDPPPIFVSDRPAILVQTNGEPVTAPVTGLSGLSFAVNTNWDLLQIDGGGRWYLREDLSWLSAARLDGPWMPVESLPEIITRLPEDDWGDARQAIPGKPYQAGGAPTVFYSDRPAELIVTDGSPVLEPVPGTALQWLSNSESDLFFHEAKNDWYFLTSGRWFRAPSLEGPWSFATPDLPEDFLNIPADTPYYAVRSAVPGTSESEEARLLASIPELARVEQGAVSADVNYAGDPEFKRIEGTDLYYAVNTEDTVIRVGDKYYVVRDGVWFVGDTPDGPFAVARSVPQAVYSIPSSSPVYNATYVRIYRTEPDAVWFGYTAGYLHGYLAWGTFVYGSGWYYRPYWHRWKRHRYPIYFHRHVTYGCGIYYNPVRRAFGRYGRRYGPHRGLGFGKRYHHRKKRYVRDRPALRRDRRREFVSAYNPRRNLSDDQVSALAGNDVYQTWNSKGVKRSRIWARDRQPMRGTKKRWRNSADRAADGKDVYAGRDGQVYRRKNGAWQRHDGSRWSAARETDGDDRVQAKRLKKAEKKADRRKRKTKRKTVRTRRQKPHLRRSFDGRKAANRKTIRKRQSATKAPRQNRSAKKRLLRDEKRR